MKSLTERDRIFSTGPGPISFVVTKFVVGGHADVEDAEFPIALPDPVAAIDPELAQGWSDEDVVRRWGRLFPPRDQSRRAVAVSDDWVPWRLKDAR